MEKCGVLHFGDNSATNVSHVLLFQHLLSFLFSGQKCTKIIGGWNWQRYLASSGLIHPFSSECRSMLLPILTLLHCQGGSNGSIYGTIVTLRWSNSHSIDNQTIIDFIKETIILINCNVCYLNFYISCRPWFYTFFFTISCYCRYLFRYFTTTTTSWHWIAYYVLMCR